MNLIEEAKQIASKRRSEEVERKRLRQLQFEKEVSDVKELFEFIFPSVIKSFIGVTLKDGTVTGLQTCEDGKSSFIWAPGEERRNVICHFGIDEHGENVNFFAEFYKLDPTGGAVSTYSNVSYLSGNGITRFWVNSINDFNEKCLPKLATILSNYF